MAKMKIASSRSSYSSSKTVKEEYKTVAGPKVDYSKYFMSAPKEPEYYKPSVKTDGEILKEAQNRFNGLYDTYINNSAKERDFNIAAINSSISALNPVYGQRINTLKESYLDNEKQLMNSAMSKGMGRSSYLIDSKKENNLKMTRDINYVNEEKQRKTDQLKQGIKEEYIKFENSKDKYNAQRNFEIAKLTAQMEKERDKTLFDAQKYNDGLYQNYSKLLLDRQKHNLNVQKYIDSLNTKKVTVTTTTKTTKSTTYKPEAGVDREAVGALWGQMSGGQKIKYVQQNRNALKTGAPDLLSRYSTEAAQYGVNYAINKLKNLFT